MKTPSPPDALSPQSRTSVYWLAVLALSGWYFALRVTGITSLPIFCDEAIILRWAQLVSRSPLRNAFVALADPKPPLHSWLLALGRGLSSDPLVAGRLVSVFAGFLTLLATAGFCRELNLWRKKQPDCEASSQLFVLLAILFTLFSPYIAVNQRLVLADPLFLLTSVAAAWMSLRARRLLDEQLSLVRGLFQVSLPLGLIMAAALLTRQGVSYTLWLLPLLAQFVGHESVGRPRRGAATLWLAVSVVIACALWIPTVCHGIWGALVANWPTIKDRLVYRTDYYKPLSLSERLAQIKGNFITVFVPSASGQVTGKDILQGLTGQPRTGWYWFYLTPPVFLLSLVSLVYLAARRQWRVLLFLGAYFGAMTAPFLLVGTRFYSRHLLYGVIPLLVAVAWMLADLIPLGSRWIKNARVRIACGVVLAGILFVPSARQILLQDFQPSRQALTLDDYNQYIDGWPAGYAPMRAVQYVKDLARQKPVVLITTDGWGPPPDVMWLYLDGYPNVSVYFITWFGKEAVLKEVGNGRYLLRRDKWLPQPSSPEPVAIDPAAIVLLALIPNEASDSNEKVIQEHDRIIGEPVYFSNNEFISAPGPGNGTALYQLDHSAMSQPQ